MPNQTNVIDPNLKKKKQVPIALEETFKTIQGSFSDLIKRIGTEGVTGAGGKMLIEPTKIPGLEDEVKDRALEKEPEDLTGRVTKALTEFKEAPSLVEEKVRLEEEKGVLGMRETVGSFEEEVTKTQTLLDQLEEDITARTKGFLVSEPQRRRVEAAERYPLLKQLGITERGLATAASRLGRTEEDILTELGLIERERKEPLEVLATEISLLKNIKELKEPAEGDLLSPNEAATLGVAYGTTEQQAAAMGITPERWAPETIKPDELTYKQKVDLEVKLGKDFEGFVKEAREANRSIGVIETGYNEAVTAGLEGTSLNAPSQAVLVSFQRMLDPTSVVRESEYARSGAGLSLWRRIEGTYAKLKFGGAGLTQKDLQEFYEVALKLQEGYQSQMLNFAKRTQTQAENYDLDLENILTPDVLNLLEGGEGATPEGGMSDEEAYQLYLKQRGQ